MNGIKITNANISQYFTLVKLSDEINLNKFECEVSEYTGYLIKDAVRSQRDMIADTWLLLEKKNSEIAAYMSLIADSLTLTVSEKEWHNLDYPFRTVPAMKIAKLAVDKTFGKIYGGIGTAMINIARAFAIDVSENYFACRFVTVDADVEHNESVVEFYIKNGFVSNEAVNNPKRTKTISMRKDIFRMSE